MPFIKNFRATTIWKAFALNSLASSLIILLAITIKSNFDNYVDEKNRRVIRRTTWSGVFLTLLFTFLATFMAYAIMFWTFGYGSGMLAD